MLRSDLRGYSDAYIVVKGTITVIMQKEIKQQHLKTMQHLKIMHYLSIVFQKLVP